ncbi:hypothetical protein [Leisingera aquaemixtae]|uniref:Uncharacterized protein n=1 Tax=Leisingera aquaemixtae TaxID=1396826 RepID=A0A0N7M4A4_9RHOB|nr:hypothetical protein [Leisingera aquaemixtae]CUH99082.1 hypothetical protein PHA8399_01198 [Leisingera aquaemixtae]
MPIETVARTRRPFDFISVFLIFTLISEVALTEAQDLDEQSKQFFESVKKSDTAGVVRNYGGFSNSASGLFSSVVDGILELKDAVDLLDRAVSVWSGEATDLERVQRIIDNDISTLSGAARFGKWRTPDFAIDQELISSDPMTAAREYSRVTDLIYGELERIDSELGFLESEKSKFEDVSRESNEAYDRGLHLQKVFEEINSDGVSAILGTDYIWVEMAVYIQPALAKRAGAAEDALNRVDAQIENLKRIRTDAANLGEWANFFAWYELLREGVRNSRLEFGGLDSLKKSEEIAGRLGSKSARSMEAVLQESVAVIARGKEAVEQLAASAASKDEAAAKSGNYSNILGLLSAFSSAANSSSSERQPRQSAPVTFQKNIYNFIVNPLESKDDKAGSGVPIPPPD